MLALASCVPLLLLANGIDVKMAFLSQTGGHLAWLYVISIIVCFFRGWKIGVLAVLPSPVVLFFNWLPMVFVVFFPACGFGGACFDLP